MIVITHKAKVTGHTAVLIEQIARLNASKFPTSQIAYILIIPESIVEKVLKNNSIDIVSENEGYELQKLQIDVEFFTDVNFTITNKEEYYFYRLIYNFSGVKDLIQNYVSSSYCVDVDQVLDNLQDEFVKWNGSGIPLD